MNRFFAKILLAACLFAPAAASAQAVLQRCDKPMAEAEAAIRTVGDCYEALIASRALAAQVAAANRTNADTRVMKIEYSTTPIPADVVRASMAEPMITDLIEYHAYLAFGSAGAAGCAPLQPIGAEARCQALLGKLNFIRAQQGSAAELNKACMAAETHPDPSSAACCAMLPEARASANPCGQMVPKCMPDLVTCRPVFAVMKGDPSLCRAIPAPREGDGCNGQDCRRIQLKEIARCEGSAAYARAVKAKNIGECGLSDVCRTLMGAGKQVAKELADKNLKGPAGDWFVKRAWAKQIPAEVKWIAPAAAAAPAGSVKKVLEFKGFVCSDALASIENRRAAAAMISAAQVCLSDVEGALQNPTREVSDGIDARAEKLARLTLRLENYFGSGGTGAKPAPKPAPAGR